MKGASGASGVIVVDKPRGPTSHDVVMRVRRALKTRAVGHAGTLDPMATGVLVIAVGEATKLVPWLTGHDKSYEASIALGVETDTLDAEGREGRREPVGGELTAALAAPRHLGPGSMLEGALASERARTTQIPPAYSAIKSEGQRAYAMARRGEPIDLGPRGVRVHRLELVACGVDPPFLSVALDVGKGYYVRSLARDLAHALGTVGHLTSLRRVASGSFRSTEAVAPDASADDLLACLQPLAKAAARTLPVATLSEGGARDARHGRPVQTADIVATTAGASAWLDADGELVAVGEVDENGRGRVLRGFARSAVAVATPGWPIARGEVSNALGRPPKGRLGIAARHGVDQRLQIAQQRGVRIRDLLATGPRPANPLRLRWLRRRVAIQLLQLAHAHPDPLAGCRSRR